MRAGEIIAKDQVGMLYAGVGILQGAVAEHFKQHTSWSNWKNKHISAQWWCRLTFTFVVSFYNYSVVLYLVTHHLSTQVLFMSLWNCPSNYHACMSQPPLLAPTSF